MTTDGLEIPMYFKTVENYFHEFEVEDDLKIALLLPSMNEKARKVITRLSATQREDYEEVKKQVLREFKMTPRAYRMQFLESAKEATESWMQYASRLETIFSYYMEGRSVETIEKLTQLIVSDRMKDTMPYKLKEYILTKEGEEWLEPRVLAEAADVYVSNVGEQFVNFKHKSGSSGNHSGNKPVAGNDNRMTSDPSAGRNVNEKSMKSENKQGFQNRKSEQGNWRSNPPNSRMPIKCYICGGPHLQRNCTNTKSSIKRVQAVVADGGELRNEQTERVELDADSELDSPTTLKEVENEACKETSSKTLALKVSVCGKSNLNEVAIKLQDVRVKCVVDSGADITVLHQSLLPECFKEPAGKIRLKGAFGQVIEADVLTLPMTLDDPETKNDVNQVNINALITVAVTPLLDAGLECLLM